MTSLASATSASRKNALCSDRGVAVREAYLSVPVGGKKKPAQGITTELVNLFEGACPNCVYISKIPIRMSMGILKAL